MNHFSQTVYHINRSPFQAKTHQVIPSRFMKSPACQVNAEQIIIRLERQVQQTLACKPQADVQCKGTLEQVLKGFEPQHHVSQHYVGQCSVGQHGVGQYQKFKQLGIQIQAHQTTIALDFGWTNFVVFLCSDGWGVIPNLHPNNSWLCRVQKLQGLQQEIRNHQRQLKTTSLEYQRLQTVVSQIQAALRNQKGFKESVRQAMFDRLELLCSSYTTVITESLNVERLYGQVSKRKAIDDLDWWHLLERLERITQNQTLVMVSHPNKSLQCAVCQHSSYKNRSGNDFRCQKCGVSPNPDLVALLNFWQEWLEQQTKA